MKIILTGATGFVGAEVLAQLLRRNDIASVTVLTRRPIPAQHAKLHTILHDDLAGYPSDLGAHLATHNALLWTLGGASAGQSNQPAFERITCTYPVACAAAIAAHAAIPFRFGYLSTAAADPNEHATLPWRRVERNLKGSTERQLQALTVQHPNFRATAFRPSSILPAGNSTLINALLAPIAIRVDHLAHAMIEETTRKIAERFSTLNNATLRKIANPSH